MNKTPSKTSNKSNNSSRKNSKSKSPINKEQQSSTKQKATFELSTLRINSIENTPSPIEHICCLPSLSILALCRSDSSIEIWTTNTWIQVIKFPGLKSLQTRRVFLYHKKNVPDSAPLINKIRLFTCGINGYLVEWSLLSNLPKFSYKNPGGCIWDMQFKDKICLIASNDGTPRAVKVKKSSNPYLIKQFAKSDSRILSVCWENSTIKTKTRLFYTGHSNGTICKWNFETGQTLLTLSNPSADNDILIWTMCSINSKYLLCGDSTGKLLVYDINFGVLVKEFKEHTADILSIVSNGNPNEPSAYFTGIDSLICNVKLNTKNNEWILTSSFRGQSHDINSLSLLNENYLLSGGITTDICINHLYNGNMYQKYEKKINTNVKRHISPFEHKQNYYLSDFIDSSKKNILILHKKHDYCDLWILNINSNTSTYLAKIYKNKKNDSNILSANISRDGKLIMLSYDDITSLFSYDYDKNEIKKIKEFKHQSNYIFFSSDSSKAYLLSQKTSKVYIIDINALKVLKEISLNKDKDIILTCDFNYESNAIAYSTLSKQVYYIDTVKEEINSVPHPDCFISKIKFNTKNNTLILIDEYNLIYIVDIPTMKFTQWTTDRIEKTDFPINYVKWYNKIYGITIISKDVFLLYTDYNYIKVDLTKQLPKESLIEKNKMDKYVKSDWEKIIKEFHQKIFDEEYKGKEYSKIRNDMFSSTSNKKVPDISLDNDNFKIVSKFNSIMLMDMINENTMLVVENDWNKIVKTFPGGVIKPNYGH